MLIIFAGQLIDGVSETTRKNQVLTIETGRIQSIEDFNSVREVDFTQANYVDARDKVVMPGMIDGHVHLLSQPHRAEPYHLGVDSKDNIAAGIVNLEKMISVGVTTVRDCGGGYGILELRDIARDHQTPLPHVVLSGPPITITRGHCFWFGIEADKPHELRNAVSELAGRGVDFIKVMGSGGFSTHNSDVCYPQYSLDDMDLIRSEVHRMRKRVAVHAHSTLSILYAVKAGVDVIEHCTWLGPGDRTYGTHYRPKIVDEMVERNIYVSCAFGCVERGKRRSAEILGPNELELYLQERDRFVANLQEMNRSGVKLFIGTDAGVGSIHFRDYPLAIEDAVNLMGFTPMEAILMSTKIAAEASGLGNITGSLESGKRGDVLILNGNPLEDISNIRSVCKVIKDGLVV